MKEKPYYYANTVENGVVIEHEGEEEYAVYLSEIKQTRKRADLWHDWVSKNVPNAYNAYGVMKANVYDDADYARVRESFMSGKRTK